MFDDGKTYLSLNILEIQRRFNFFSKFMNILPSVKCPIPYHSNGTIIQGPLSGVAKTFPGGCLTHPEGQKVDKYESLRKIRKNDGNFRKNEKSGTLAQPGL